MDLAVFVFSYDFFYQILLKLIFSFAGRKKLTKKFCCTKDSGGGGKGRRGTGAFMHNSKGPKMGQSVSQTPIMGDEKLCHV